MIDTITLLSFKHQLEAYLPNINLKYEHFYSSILISYSVKGTLICGSVSVLHQEILETDSPLHIRDYIIQQAKHTLECIMTNNLQ